MKNTNLKACARAWTMLLVGLGVLSSASLAAPTQVAKLLASDPEAGDGFGRVSISGNWAIVAAPGEDTGGLDAGAAYFFERDGSGTWNFVTKVQASDRQAGDNFGVSVSMSGDRALVGAFARPRGVAYIFEHDGSGTWSQVAKLQASDEEEGDGFGHSVSLSGDRALVGAGTKKLGEGPKGAAYIYERDGSGAWNEVARLLAGDGDIFDQFGHGVSLDGDRAIIGAYLEDTGGEQAGAAYFFERDDTGTWNFVTKVQASDPETVDQFGLWVSISGDRAIVGAHKEDTGASEAGAAYFFERDDTGAWNFVTKVQASDRDTNHGFGWGAFIRGDRAIVGSLINGAYVFERDEGGPWRQVHKLQSDDFHQSHGLGRFVSFSGDRIIVGAIFEDTGGLQAGAAYVFEDPDRDGDGVPDDRDACPDEDSTGFDADQDGCIDSFQGLGAVLATLVAEGVIASEMEKSLCQSVENAESSADRDNICTAINQLDSFQQHIDAQTGMKISVDAATLLLAYSDNLIAQLLLDLPNGESCPNPN